MMEEQAFFKDFIDIETEEDNIFSAFNKQKEGFNLYSQADNEIQENSEDSFIMDGISTSEKGKDSREN